MCISLNNPVVVVHTPARPKCALRALRFSGRLRNAWPMMPPSTIREKNNRGRRYDRSD